MSKSCATKLTDITISSIYPSDFHILEIVNPITLLTGSNQSDPRPPPLLGPRLPLNEPRPSPLPFLSIIHSGYPINCQQVFMFIYSNTGNLLTRAGFSLPGVDVDDYVVKHKSALDLIDHLRAMGETNALLHRNKACFSFFLSSILNRETALATAAIYDSMFATEDGTIPATFQVIYMTGWREHSSHPQAKRRGSATVSFTDIQKQFGAYS
ncbi:hypothetical protein Bca52824_072465 [Brassica carinata]|uniref:Uncharacterized protein n=1 Tax=Brassica carinata TaxID=52824 RepID=A0A8X7U6Y7_BRACI|nr:hypothetical protein Bca52824_072465 [Brassica carinata]